MSSCRCAYTVFIALSLCACLCLSLRRVVVVRTQSPSLCLCLCLCPLSFVQTNGQWPHAFNPCSMPAVLAGCEWTGKVGGPTSSSPTITVNPGAGKCTGHTFKYNGVSQPPKNDNYDAWYALVKATVSHAVERYGLDEVRTWSFEVWNELWGMPFPNEYMKLYVVIPVWFSHPNPFIVQEMYRALLSLLSSYKERAH